MYHVRYFEKKNLLLCQLLKNVPSVGSEVRIKGRKGAVTSIDTIGENTLHVQVLLEKNDKKKLAADDSKKKKRK